MSYLARYNKIGGVDYSKLIVPEQKNNPPIINKKILVLENDLSYFQKNKLATPYLNWRLSEDVFRNPGYYENTIEVYQALKNYPPDLIVDKENLMKPFFDAMPELKRKFIRRENLYLKNTSN
jgi:hypothetical protein